jgi:hypothetical protein
MAARLVIDLKNIQEHIFKIKLMSIKYLFAEEGLKSVKNKIGALVGAQQKKSFA